MVMIRGKRRVAAAVAALTLVLAGGGAAAASGGGGDLRPADTARGGSSTVERAPQPGSDGQPVPGPR